ARIRRPFASVKATSHAGLPADLGQTRRVRAAGDRLPARLLGVPHAPAVVGRRAGKVAVIEIVRVDPADREAARRLPGEPGAPAELAILRPVRGSVLGSVRRGGPRAELLDAVPVPVPELVPVPSALGRGAVPGTRAVPLPLEPTHSPAAAPTHPPATQVLPGILVHGAPPRSRLGRGLAVRAVR